MLSAVLSGVLAGIVFVFFPTFANCHRVIKVGNEHPPFIDALSINASIEFSRFSNQPLLMRPSLTPSLGS